MVRKPEDVQLRGGRFPGLKWEEMSPEQKAIIEDVLGGERASADGPFNVMLRSPQFGDLAQKLGAVMRYQSSLPKKLNELAIILTARHWTSQFEWYLHRRAAAQAGLEEAKILAIALGERPANLDADEEIVYNFAAELLSSKQVSDPTFNAMRDRFGERGVVDAIGVIGYYQMVSMMLNVDRYPLPDSAKPELKPLP
jgi:4-carboxymuconolactone decarboxylase